MSDDNGNEPKQRTASVTRLINPTVRSYMDTLSLQRFYGGYVLQHIDEHVFNLGIGEVAGIPLSEDLYQVYSRFEQQERLTTLATRYSGTLGEQDTNRIVAKHMNELLGEERFHEMGVVSLDGGQNAVEVALRTFTSPLGSKDSSKQYVLLAAPSYPYFSMIIAAHAGIMSFLAFDSEQFTKGVETYCNSSVGAIIVNVPHNPMGYALDAGQVARVNNMAQVHDCAIIVDAVYGNYPAGEDVGRALAGFDPDRTIYCDSFSKKFGLPGLRIGFALSAAEELTYAMRFIKTAESLTPSNGKLAFAGHMLEHYAEVPRQIGEEVRKRRARFEERFDPAAIPGVGMIGEADNPFYQTLDISGLSERCDLPDTQVAMHCLDHYNVRVFPGFFVYPNKALEHGVFSAEGRHNPHGNAPFLPPRFEADRQIIYAPDHMDGRKPLLRLSFGSETRMDGAAEALTTALGSLV